MLVARKKVQISLLKGAVFLKVLPLNMWACMGLIELSNSRTSFSSHQGLMQADKGSFVIEALIVGVFHDVGVPMFLEMVVDFLKLSMQGADIDS
jgi:hypothetical protein